MVSSSTSSKKKYTGEYKRKILIQAIPATKFSENFFSFRAVKPTYFRMTVGVDFITFKVELQNKEYATFSSWLIGGAKRFEFMRSSFYKGTHGVIYVFDLTEKNSWEEIKKRFQETIKITGKIPSILIGEHFDPSKSIEVDRREINRFCRKYGLKYMKTTLKNKFEVIRKSFYMLVKRTTNENPIKSEYPILNLLEENSLIDLQKKLKRKIPRVKKKFKKNFGYKISDSRVSEIFLENQNIDELPSSFAVLTDLQKINLENNKFTTIPSQLWQMEQLRQLYMKKNPLESKSEQITQNINSIRKFCRSKMNINIFISYSLKDAEAYSLGELAHRLREREGIGEVFYFTESQSGQIDYYMTTKIPQSQVFLFIGSLNSVESSACISEIYRANDHGLMILPFLVQGLDWSSSKLKIKSSERSDIVDLAQFRGVAIDPDNEKKIKDCWDEVFSLIDEMKSEFNLYDRTHQNIELLVNEITSFLKQPDVIKSFKSDKELNSLVEKFKGDEISRDKLLKSFFESSYVKSFHLYSNQI